jgi:asparaginyl-tRNA synthetase
MSITTTIDRLPQHVGEQVRLRGWVYQKRRKGKIAFLVLRDGTGRVQCVALKKNVGEELFDTLDRLPQESSIIVDGEVKEDARSAGGVEVGLTGLEVVQESEPYPITPKEHGVDFLMEHRHLWVRSSRQHAILRIRAEVIAAAQEWLNDQGFVRYDTPILTPCACEGTTDLFETPYFDQGSAFLAQSGQLYVESGMMSFGKVYCFGPTFRSEKSKTRRHLTEFWMLEPEVAYATQEDNEILQEQFMEAVVQRVLERRGEDLDVLERDRAPLEAVKAPFPRVTYDEAVKRIGEAVKAGEDLAPMEWGEDFGAPHEVWLSSQFDRPIFVTGYPSAVKAFYMEPQPDRPEVALCADLLAPGYGEIFGGSQRIHDPDLLQQRIREHGLPEEEFRWYVDLRRFGSVPHSGFGVGIERVVAWICGNVHLRECIPFPRMRRNCRSRPAPRNSPAKPCATPSPSPSSVHRKWSTPSSPRSWPGDTCSWRAYPASARPCWPGRWDACSGSPTPAYSARRTSCPRTSWAQRSWPSPTGNSVNCAFGRARSSLTFSWWTRSIAPHRRRSRLCWRPCRRARSRSVTRRTPSRIPSS